MLGRQMLWLPDSPLPFSMHQSMLLVVCTVVSTGQGKYFLPHKGRKNSFVENGMDWSLMFLPRSKFTLASILSTHADVHAKRQPLFSRMVFRSRTSTSFSWPLLNDSRVQSSKKNPWLSQCPQMAVFSCCDIDFNCWYHNWTVHTQALAFFCDPVHRPMKASSLRPAFTAGPWISSSESKPSYTARYLW